MPAARVSSTNAAAIPGVPPRANNRSNMAMGDALPLGLERQGRPAVRDAGSGTFLLERLDAAAQLLDRLVLLQRVERQLLDLQQQLELHGADVQALLGHRFRRRDFRKMPVGFDEGLELVQRSQAVLRLEDVVG